MNLDSVLHSAFFITYRGPDETCVTKLMSSMHVPQPFMGTYVCALFQHAVVSCGAFVCSDVFPLPAVLDVQAMLTMMNIMISCSFSQFSIKFYPCFR